MQSGRIFFIVVLLLLLITCGKDSPTTATIDPDPDPEAGSPKIESISPLSAPQGTILEVEIQGTGFTENTTFDFGNGISINSMDFADNTSVTIEFSIAADAPLGPRTAIAINPGLDGDDGLLENAFYVALPAPGDAETLTIHVNEDDFGEKQLRILTAFGVNNITNGEADVEVVSRRAQLIQLIDEKNTPQGFTLSYPTGSDGVKASQMNIQSTVATLLYMTPGIMSLEEEVEERFETVMELACLPSTASLLQDLMTDMTLEAAIRETVVEDALIDCVAEALGLDLNTMEATGGGLLSLQMPDQVEESSGFKITRTGLQIEMENSAWRFVSVHRRDGNQSPANRVTRIMGGAVPLSLGSALTRSAHTPTVRSDPDFADTETSTSDYWVLGFGWDSNDYKRPEDIPRPILANLVTGAYYFLMPLSSVISGFELPFDQVVSCVIVLAEIAAELPEIPDAWNKVAEADGFMQKTRASGDFLGMAFNIMLLSLSELVECRELESILDISGVVNVTGIFTGSWNLLAWAWDMRSVSSVERFHIHKEDAPTPENPIVNVRGGTYYSADAVYTSGTSIFLDFDSNFNESVSVRLAGSPFWGPSWTYSTDPDFDTPRSVRTLLQAPRSGTRTYRVDVTVQNEVFRYDVEINSNDRLSNPDNLEINDLSASSVSVSWNSVPDAQSYMIAIADGSDCSPEQSGWVPKTGTRRLCSGIAYIKVSGDENQVTIEDIPFEPDREYFVALMAYNVNILESLTPVPNQVNNSYLPTSMFDSPVTSTDPLVLQRNASDSIEPVLFFPPK